MKNMYCLKDTLTCFQNPFLSINDNTAIRDIKLAYSMANDVEKNKAKDFQLFKVGTFDEDTGALVGDLVFICNCSDLITFDKKDEVLENGKE